MRRTVRDVVFVDGVRTPFGKAGPKSQYAETRADDLVVALIRELLRRNPGLPPEKIGDKQLPRDVSFATDAAAIATFLSNTGYAPSASDRSGALSPEALTRLGSDVTVLVSCWE